MEIFTLAVVSIAILGGLFVRARRRLRDENRRAVLQRAVDPSRGGSSSLDEAESGRDRQA
jgi:hypothetical protein